MAKKNKKAKPLSESDARDLDETRRLAYMLLVDVPDKKYRDLAGTLVNAIAHHQEAATVYEALEQVAALAADAHDEEARQWMLEHTQRITAALTE